MLQITIFVLLANPQHACLQDWTNHFACFSQIVQTSLETNTVHHRPCSSMLYYSITFSFHTDKSLSWITEHNTSSPRLTNISTFLSRKQPHTPQWNQNCTENLRFLGTFCLDSRFSQISNICQCHTVIGISNNLPLSEVIGQENLWPKGMLSIASYSVHMNSLNFAFHKPTMANKKISFFLVMYSQLLPTVLPCL